MKTLTLFAALLSAMASAQSTSLIGTARGEGSALAPTGQRANFDFLVRRAGSTTSSTPVLTGHFAFVIPGPQGASVPFARRIVMPSVHTLAFVGRAANFSGLATMMMPSSTGMQTIQGRVEVHVEDWIRPNAPASNTTTRDRLSVRFFNLPTANTPTPPPIFQYNGLVARGDILVTTPTP